MTDKELRQLRRRVHNHTARVYADCPVKDNGAEIAVKSSNRLIEFVEELVRYKSLQAHSAGYAEAKKEKRR